MPDDPREEDMTRLQPQRTRLELKAIFGLLLALVVTGAFAAAGSAASGSSAGNRPLHVTKECSQYNGTAGSYCTITSSDLAAITVGSRVVYLSAAGATSLDSDIVLVVGPSNYALGHVKLDFATGTGTVRLSGGIGQFASFHAKVAVSALGGPNWAWDGKYHFGQDDD
jgi:hypothetical protein